ncbi:MAG: enoyl-CoA hydratase/isomerase family protein [Candidatus Promineofilum sp.]|nr:enoyl-CoA hydratase/isomerase family protein [Promineifilum sp.]
MRVNRQGRNALTWSTQEGFAQAVAAARAADARGYHYYRRGPGVRLRRRTEELANHPEAAAGERLNRVMSAALDDLVALPCPVIAAVNGDAIGGGCEILTACDLRLAAPGARFAFRQVHNGLTTGWARGALVALVGQSRATELLLTGRTFDAAEAQALGLVHRLAAPGENRLDAAASWAAELPAPARAAPWPPSKRWPTPRPIAPADTNRLEAQLFINLWPSADPHRGRWAPSPRSARRASTGDHASGTQS